jgi:3'-phosphoadenosine 5'-phosphosulfate sulfotransferase (PAPS reductase)/FAD synthetase
MNAAENTKETPEQIIHRAIGEYAPSHIFALFSGGDDSLTVSHFAATALGDRISGVVHINTGIGLKETRQHVDTVCALFSWRLLEYKAKDLGQDYEQIVLEHGFPGPTQHPIIYRRLKERALEALVRDHQGGNVMLISGVRQRESSRRMRLSEPVHRDKGRRVWCAPFFYRSNEEIQEYRNTVLADVPVNPAKQYLCMSGECLCGCFAHKGDLSQVEFFFPEAGRYLRDLQARVHARGYPWSWDDEGPPRWWSRRQAATKSGQVDAFEQEFHEEVKMLCSSCEFRHEINQQP